MRLLIVLRILMVQSLLRSWLMGQQKTIGSKSAPSRSSRTARWTSPFSSVRLISMLPRLAVEMGVGWRKRRRTRLLMWHL